PAHGGCVDIFRHKIERHSHRTAQQSPRTAYNYNVNDKAGHRIDPMPSGQKNDHPCDDDTSGDRSVRSHMKKGAFDIEIAFVPAEEQHRCHSVKDDADSGHNYHGLSANFSRITESPNGFPCNAADREE